MTKSNVNLTFKIEYDEVALHQLEKIDKQVAKRIIKWLDGRLCDCLNPRLWGKALKGNIFGENWCYRVGDYRILCNIQDTKVIVMIVNIGHRKDVYKI